MKKIILLFLTVMLGMGAFAQTTYSWSGAIDGNWNKAGNWSGNAVPNGGSILSFGNDNQLTMTNNLPATTFHQIIFTNAATQSRIITGTKENIFYDYSGKKPKIENNSSANQTIDFPLKWGNSVMELNPVLGDLTFTKAINNNGIWTDVWGGNGKTLSIASMSGTGGLTIKNNPTTVKITGTSTYTGKTYVNFGTLELQADLSSEEIIVANEAKLIINGNDVDVEKLTINSGGTVEVKAGKSLTVKGALNNNGTLNLLSSLDGTATILTNGTVSGSGTTTVNQAITTGRFWYVASPVSSAASTVLGTSVYYYNAAATPSAYATTTALSPGVGYAVSPSGTNFAFTGTLNNGAQSATIAYNGNTADAFRGYNLIGNPYPSALNWNNVWANETNKTIVGSTIWFNANGTFATYNATGTVGVPSDVKGYIPPMQGFWVLATDAASSTTSSNKTLALDNTMRSHGPATGSNPLRAPQSAASENQLIRLQATNGTTTDETVLYFNSQAADTYDNYDSRKMMSDNASQIYTLLNGMPIVINGMNSIPYNTEIPVAFKTVAAGEYTIKASEFSNFTSGESLILTDKTNGTQTDLSVSDYTFTSSIGTDVSRFALTIQRVSTSVEGNNSQNSLQVVQTNGRIQILLPSFESGAVAYVYNNIGQIAAKSDITGTVTTMNQNLPSGVYIVKVMTGTHELTEKIIIK